MARVCFVTAGQIHWASSRMRAYWVAPYMDDATVITFEKCETGGPPEADVYIFQKWANPETLAKLKKRDKVIWWDVCDPLHWFGPDDCKRIAEHVDGIVASNQGLAMDLAQWLDSQVFVIPDRLELSHFPRQREHQETTPTRFIWFGLAANGYEIALTIMDERSDVKFADQSSYPIYHVKWELDKENEIIASHDIALLPPYPGPWGEVKSNNKQVTAWACGIPVMTGTRWHDGIIKIVSNAQARKISGRTGRKMAEAEYDVVMSAGDWQRLLDGPPTAKQKYEYRDFVPARC